ncbi:MAG: proton-conducting transporter membrane subunit [Methanomicrobium sp.]|nr:proton-conducting transporter membrane subunit [Methanomicrobium sp.]
MLDLLVFLILFPLIAAALMLVLPNGGFRDAVIKIAALITAAASIYLFIQTFDKGISYLTIGSELVGNVILLAEFAIALFIIAISLKFKHYIIALLAVIQTVILVYAEKFASVETILSNELFVDEFSVIMALIIGIIGSLICIYSVGYMRGYHENHTDVKDHRKLFFFLMFLFLSAMFGVVFSNHIVWMFFFWEITTLCSFLLIGYARDEIAWKNAFWALLLNTVGGVGFSGAILFILVYSGNGEFIYLNNLITAGPVFAMIPAALIAFAGLTKSAQLPFSSWLVGAMVAPTPVSALLHSSTMVKAGVYVIVRFAPVFEMSMVGVIISLVGGVTFLLASAIAIGQSNAKKVLAYSTIANLGLVVACAGIGTQEAVWAAILLIIFHAVAKSLLFLAVGSVEHQKHSRDIEDMSGLISTMPKIAVMMLIGIAGMFLAPFGMLISKWATIHAFVNALPPFGMLLIAIIAYGSGITVFFWAKWMGKLIEVKGKNSPLKKEATSPEMFTLYSLSGLTVIVCLLFPLISGFMIEPYLKEVYGTVSGLLSLNNILIMLMMLVLILILPLTIGFLSKNKTLSSQYMGARPAVLGESFSGSMGITRNVTLSNYYMEEYFGEEKLSKTGNILTILLLFVLAGIIALIISGMVI